MLHSCKDKSFGTKINPHGYRYQMIEEGARLSYIILIYYTIIDFNEVYMSIHLPEKSIIHRGRKAGANIT